MSSNFTFEKVLDDDGQLLWLGAREQELPQRFYVWVPNTKAWHRYPEFEAGPGYVEGVVFEQCAPEEIQRLLPGNRRIDERVLGWVVDEFRSQPESEVRSSVDLGLPFSAGPQPTRDVDISALEVGEWMTLKRYPAEEYRRAVSLASDIRLGKRKNLLLPGFRLEARVEGLAPGYVVQIRKIEE